MADDRNDVYRDALYAFFHMIRVLNRNVIDSFVELSADLEISEVRRNAGINAQAAVRRKDAEDVLGDIHKGPGRCAGEPAVFGFPVQRGVFSCDHLGIYIGLRAVDFADILNISGDGGAGGI